MSWPPHLVRLGVHFSLLSYNKTREGTSKYTKTREDDIEYKSRDHALFIAFAPYKNPQYAISVVVEHGGSGSSSAAPVAKKIIKKVLERHELRKAVSAEAGTV